MSRRCPSLALLVASLAGIAAQSVAQTAAADDTSFACRPHVCSSLVPSRPVDQPQSRDCGYINGNQWWLDHVAGTLAWAPHPQRRIVVALFDDGAQLDHPDLRGQAWTNEAEAHGQPGVDDDRNGYVDDIEGWDFVDDDARVAPEGACVGRASHGTFMASLIAAKRDNGAGIAASGSDAARLMILRVAGCGASGPTDASADPKSPVYLRRLERALAYASAMGADILSFSSHWTATTPALDAAFAELADRRDLAHPAIVIASVPNKGERELGFPAAYPFRRIIRAVPIGDGDRISPGTTAAPPGLDFGVPSACVLGATTGSDGFALRNGSSNSTAIMAGLLAGIWASPPYARFDADAFVERVVREKMLDTPRRSAAGVHPAYREGVPLADACLLAASGRSARVCEAPPGRKDRHDDLRD